MNRDQAKLHLRSKWEPYISKYNLSCTDSYTDGFWAGRTWAAAKLIEALGKPHRQRVLDLLEVAVQEAKRHGI